MLRFKCKISSILRASAIPCVFAGSTDISTVDGSTSKTSATNVKKISVDKVTASTVVLGEYDDNASSAAQSQSSSNSSDCASSNSPSSSDSGSDNSGRRKERPLIWDRFRNRFTLSMPYDVDAYRDPLQGMHGMDAVKTFYSTLISNEPAIVSLDCRIIKKSVFAATLIGFVWGNITAHRQSLTNIKSLVTATRFTSLAHGQQVIYDKTTSVMAVSGLRRMWRVVALTTMYLMVLQSGAVYSGRYHLLHFLAAGAAAGSMYRIAISPQALVGGAILGGALGLVHAAVCMPYFYFSGRNLPELREEYKETIVTHLKKTAEKEEKLKRGDNYSSLTTQERGNQV